jgi:hypothetical protein
MLALLLPPPPKQVLAGAPVETNPSLGSGFKVMDVAEWAARWKTSGEFPQCLACGSSNTKEHAFTQVRPPPPREQLSHNVGLPPLSAGVQWTQAEPESILYSRIRA